MATLERRHPKNAAGPFFVDDTCIDCDASRQCAPSVFASVDGQSVVRRQPATPDEIAAATRAMLACPTASIGVVGAKPATDGLFPQPIAAGVSYCGFNSPKSYGANAFFVERAGGNLLVDSPRFVPQLAREIERRGGLAHVLLTHEDDVADARAYAERFGARVWIHEADRRAAPFATDVLEGGSPTSLAADLVAVPVPGHTRGSVVYLFAERFAFTGDSLYWSRAAADLSAFREYCWYSWEEQTRSLSRLAEHRFEWVLAGHGDRGSASAADMRARLLGLVERMGSAGFASDW